MYHSRFLNIILNFEAIIAIYISLSLNYMKKKLLGNENNKILKHYHFTKKSKLKLKLVLKDYTEGVRLKLISK